MINIAIVEDSLLDQNAIKDLLEQYQTENNLNFHIFVFSSANEFWMKYNNQYDLILMDIEMKSGDNGIDVARKIFNENPHMNLIFITSFVRYAIEGYDVDAIAFLKKPVEKTSFNFSLTKALKRIKSNNEDSLLLTNKTETRRILLKDIAYFEVFGHSCVCHFADKSEFLFTDTLKKIEQKLINKNFFRIKSCYLVNLAYVNKFNNSIVEINGDKLTISRRIYKSFVDAYTKYIGKYI